MDLTKLKNAELFLFDMDGTLYLGDEVYEGAIELMEDLPRLGKKYIYLTNNSIHLHFPRQMFNSLSNLFRFHLEMVNKIYNLLYINRRLVSRSFQHIGLVIEV